MTTQIVLGMNNEGQILRIILKTERAEIEACVHRVASEHGA